MTSLSKAIYAIPLCFAAGVLIKEWRDDNVRLEAIVEKRVQQRLGEWTPEPLSPAERADLLATRRAILAEIARLDGARHRS